MATIKDVAQAAMVNVSTVSRALAGNTKISEETRRRIQKCAADLGYQPNNLARSLKERSTRILGLIISSILNPALPGVVRGVEDAAAERGYIVVLCNADNDTRREKKYIDTLRSIWVDGILMTTASDDSEHLLELKNCHCPVVLLVRQYEEHFDAVAVDNLQSANRAVRYLLDTGCARVAIVNGPQTINLYRERFQGYCSALAEKGIARDKRLEWEFPGHMRDDFYAGTLRKLREGPVPDAIVAASGPVGPSGPHILRAVKECGLRVPDDISILGFDDLVENAVTDPPLTIVSQPFYAMGRMAAERLLDKIANPGEANRPTYTTLLNTEFIVRGSTRPPLAQDGVAP